MRGGQLMKLQTTLRAPHSLLLVVSTDKPEIPATIESNSIAVHTSTCVAIGTVAEDDDDVTVVLGDELVLDDQMSLIAEVVLDTNDGFIAVETVLGDRLLNVPVASAQCGIRIRASNTHEPDRILIEVLDPR
ncbi:MAG: hypothetical protein J2O49_03160 [Sciscionella sp.]|nr:hypothetical protein [Sciscionella sp.]